MKQAIKTAADNAKQAAATNAKQIARELLEIPKQAAAEAVGVKQPGPQVQEQIQQPQTTPSYDAAKTQHENAQRLDYLEKELEELKKKREIEKQQEEYLLIQKQREEEEEKQRRMKEILEPPKKKIKLPGFANKRPKGTGEMTKSHK